MDPICSFFKDKCGYDVCNSELAKPTVVAGAVVGAAFSAFVGYRCFQWRNTKKNMTSQVLSEARRNQEAAALQMRELEQKRAQEKALRATCSAVEKTKFDNQDTLNGLGITTYRIPLAWPEGAEKLGYDTKPAAGPLTNTTLAPVFNKAKQVEIEEILSQVASSLKSGGATPLPNLVVAGVAGVGKTMLISHLCATSGVGYIKIPTGLLESQLTQGTSEQTLNAILRVAETSSVPVYIVIDDGEGLFDKTVLNFKPKVKDTSIDLPWSNEGDNINSTEVLAQRRSQLVQATLEYASKIDRKASFALTTNRAQVVGNQIKDVAISLEILPPGKDERTRILIQGLQRVFRADNPILGYFSIERLTALSTKLDGFTGRNIIKMLETLYSLVNNDPTSINDAMIDKAIGLTIPSVELLRDGKGKTSV